ncbi:hypothetical protein B0T26DRAFT_670784 [Lasiosphaeria miniovina]|uniref:Uncharacterized protein n=1 Tax=Lasiosphaeria miniovina TaxID=1954250 RepID=A0AA40EGG5_9PEZI|nr:uncharacterized protein B0T26DRAFT_670784 [Lasiosphaeria miniovina]KAK0734493.1 hypothetical protein B0T26DRAFT_670784 [Lasiosphaeria miniovina]
MEPLLGYLGTELPVVPSPALFIVWEALSDIKRARHSNAEVFRGGYSVSSEWRLQMPPNAAPHEILTNTRLRSKIAYLENITRNQRSRAGERQSGSGNRNVSRIPKTPRIPSIPSILRIPRIPKITKIMALDMTAAPKTAAGFSSATKQKVVTSGQGGRSTATPVLAVKTDSPDKKKKTKNTGNGLRNVGNVK